MAQSTTQATSTTSSMNPVKRQQAKASLGALVIGGDYRGLGVVRSLGRRGIPVWVMHDEHSLATFSRYSHRSLPWPTLDETSQVAYLVETVKKFGLSGWTVFPTGDATTALVARYNDLLGEYLRLTIPPWKTIGQLTDKRQLYQLALEVGVPCPWTCHHLKREELSSLRCDFPVILKPAERSGYNPFERDKAWKVSNLSELVQKFDEASEYVDPNNIMVQEWIPGAGEEQYSYAALYQNGHPLAELSAKRIRQYPQDFGRFSTYVESIIQPDVENFSQLLLAAIDYTGLIELEYKRHPLTGQFNLLDANPRVWGWHTLGQQAGLDFSYLQWQMAHGETIIEQRGRAGVRWMRMNPDLLVALQEIMTGRLKPAEYLASLRGPVEFAIFAPDDPMPAVVDIPLLLNMVWKRRAI